MPFERFAEVFQGVAGGISGIGSFFGLTCDVDDAGSGEDGGDRSGVAGEFRSNEEFDIGPFGFRGNGCDGIDGDECTGIGEFSLNEGESGNGLVSPEAFEGVEDFGPFGGIGEIDLQTDEGGLVDARSLKDLLQGVEFVFQLGREVFEVEDRAIRSEG